MRLSTQSDIYAFYDEIRASGQPVAWCSAFAPAEALLAAGVMPVYPENHGAMLGALSPSRDQDQPYSLAAINRSAAHGLQSPRLCSYALSDIGVLLGDADSPIHGLPEPDLFYACDSQCSVVERWGNEVQQIFRARQREIPHYVLRAPQLVRKAEHSPAELLAFRRQIEEHVEEICKQLGTTFSETRLREVVAESARANKLWQACLELARRSPSPWSNTDAFTAMAPIVIARGMPECTRFYTELLAELTARVENGVAPVPNEEVRLIWDAIPIWPRKNWLASFAAERRAIFVASTYTHSWWFDFDADNAMESLAGRYAWNTMNRSRDWVLDWTLGLVRDYRAHGIVCHWNQTCGIWNSYVKRRLPGFVEAGVPHIVIEADMVDARAFDEERIGGQLAGFIDELKGKQPFTG